MKRLVTLLVGVVLLTLTACDDEPVKHQLWCEDSCQHGECLEDDKGEGFCQCDVGYAGETCEVCDEGYIQLNDGTCTEDLCVTTSCGEHGTCEQDLETGKVSCQ